MARKSFVGSLVTMAVCAILVAILITEVDSHPVTTKCVKPDDVENCTQCTGECSTLMEYAENGSFTSNDTTFFFLPGNHSLQKEVIAKNVSNLKLAGVDTTTDRLAKVRCNRSLSAGFAFLNVINLTVERLHIHECTVQNGSYSHALFLYRITHLTINSVTITSARAIGMLIVKLFGNSQITNTTVEYSHGELGQNFALFCYNDTVHNNRLSHNLHISNSRFLHGYKNASKSRYLLSASGLLIHITCSIRMNIVLENVTVEHNSVDHRGDGGNIAIQYESYSKEWLISISIINSTIACGNSNIGAGLYFNAFRILNGTFHDHTKLGTVINTNTTVPILTVSGTKFVNNSSPYLGAAVYIRLRETEWPMVAKISFNDCQFNGQMLNQSYETSHGGVAVHIRSFQLPIYRRHSAPLFEVAFTNCQFDDNRAVSPPSVAPHNGALYVQGIDSITLEQCEFVNNYCTGIIAIQSFLLLRGRNIIRNNSGVRGGGIVLCSRSMLQLHNSTHLIINDNRAIEYGGGIYVESECDQDIPYCFFQVDDANDNSTLNKTKVILKNNTAIAGTAIYGGMVEHCVMYTNITESYQPNIAEIIFHSIFHIQDNGNSEVSSDPTLVCFCNGSAYNKSSCKSNRTANAVIVPGSYLKVYVMLLGQMNSSVPGIVRAHIQCNNSNCNIKDYQEIKQTLLNTTLCTEVEFTVYSSSDNTTGVITLTTEGGSFEYSGIQDRPTNININITKCPLGSIINPTQRVCDCLPCHKPTNITSYVYTEANPPVWIGYKKTPINSNPPPNTSLIIYHQFCPLGYCREVIGRLIIPTTSNSFFQDVQCSHYRTGLLCGSCQPGYSLGFGSSQCLPDCYSKDVYLRSVRVVGLIVVCGVAGIMLVVLLTLLNLTVAEGTLNGLIFYANIIQVNMDIFFPPETHARPWAAFIAWLNLDFGVTVCFYGGMDAYEKTWLQFIFPLYLWLISGGIIYFSRKFKRVAQLTGKNAVKVLATLFLLSFGKLLRNVIAVGLFTNVHSHDWKINISVWLHDANIHYLHGKHIILFIVSVLVGVVVLLYALLLTFIQCLRRAPSKRMCGWVQRLKPLLDAYTGPYKDKYHFWTGLLLLVRIFLFLSFAFNFKNDPTVNFTLIIVVTTLLIAIQPGIYPHQCVGLLESSMYVNLVLFSVVMMFSVGTYSKYKIIAAYVFGGWALLTFLGIIMLHAYKHWQLHVFFKRLSLHGRECTAVQPLLIQRNNSDDSEEIDEEQELSNPTWSGSLYVREPLIDSS